MKVNCCFFNSDLACFYLIILSHIVFCYFRVASFLEQLSILEMHRGSMDKAEEYLKQTKDILQPFITLESPDVGSLPGTPFLQHPKCCCCSCCCDPAMHEIQCTLFIAQAKYLKLISQNRESEAALNIVVELCQNATQRISLSLEKLSNVLRLGSISLKTHTADGVSEGDKMVSNKQRAKGRSKVAKETKRKADAAENFSFEETAEIMLSFFNATSSVTKADLLLQTGDAKSASKALKTAKDALRKAEKAQNGLTRLLIPVAAKLYLMLSRTALAMDPTCRQAIESRWNISSVGIATDTQQDTDNKQVLQPETQCERSNRTRSMRSITANKKHPTTETYREQEQSVEGDPAEDEQQESRDLPRRRTRVSKAQTKKTKAETASLEESGKPKTLQRKLKNNDNLTSDSENRIGDVKSKSKRQGRTKRKTFKIDEVDVVDTTEINGTSPEELEEKEVHFCNGMIRQLLFFLFQD